MPRLLIRANKLLLKRTEKKRHTFINAEIGRISFLIVHIGKQF